MSLPLGGAYPSNIVNVGTNLQFGNVSTTNASITTATIGELRTNVLSQNTLNVSTINASALNLPSDYVIPILNVSTLNSQKENFNNISAVNMSVSNISAEFVTADNLQTKLEAGSNIQIVGNTISAVSTFPTSPTFTNVKSSVVNTSTLNASNISTGSLQFGNNLNYSGGLLNVNSTNSITSGSSDLVTSGAVFSALGGTTTTDNARSLTNTRLYLGGNITKPLIPFTTNQVDQNVSAGTTITIMSVTYTTKLGSSALLGVQACFNYEVEGYGSDKIIARLKYGTNVIFQKEQMWVNNGGGGTRSGDLSPLVGTRTSGVSAGTNVTFSVQIVNESNDDTFFFLTPDNCTFHITETLNNESSTSLSLGVGNVQANDATFNTLNVQAGSGNGTAIIGRTQLGNLGFSNMAALSINGNTGQTNYGFAQVANNQTIMNAQSSTTYNSFRIENEEVASINNVGLAIGKPLGSTAIFPLEVQGSAFIHDDLFVDEISATKVASNNISVENVSGVTMTVTDITVLGTLNANLNFSTANLIAGDNILINSSGVISAYVSSSSQTHLNSLQVDNDADINGRLIVDEASYFRDNLHVENNLFSGVAGSMEGSVILYSNDIGNNFTTKINSSTKEVNISATGTIEHLNYFIGDVKALTLTKDVGINMEKLTINDTGNNTSTTISRLNNATSINTHNGRILIFTDDSLTPAMTLYQNRIVETERLQNETLMETRNFSVDENVSVAGSLSSNVINVSQLNVSQINGGGLSTANMSFDEDDFVFQDNTLSLVKGWLEIEDDTINNIEYFGLNMSGNFNASTANISVLTVSESPATGDALIVTGNSKLTDLNVSRNFFCEGADAYFGTPGGATPYFAPEGTPPRHKINFYSAGLSAPYEIGLRFGLNSSNQCQLELPRFGNVSLFNINISNTSTLDMDNTSTTIHNILNASNISCSVGDFVTINATNLSTGSIRFSDDFTFDTFSKTLNLAQTPQEAIAEIQENGLDTTAINTSGLNVDGLASFDDVGISGTLQVPSASITTLNCCTANTSNINSSNGKIKILNSSTINASNINVPNYGTIDANIVNCSNVIATTKVTATRLEVTNDVDTEAVYTNTIATINMSASNIVQAKTSNAQNGNFSTINASNINGYQRQLTAGANITITNNVISADDASLPADVNFSSVTTDLLNVSTINVSSINGNNLSTASISFNATDFNFTSNQLNLAVPVSQIETDTINLIESTGLDMTGNLNVDLLNGTTANISTLNASTITASGIVTTGNELRIGLNDNSTTPKTIAFGGMLNDNSYDHSIITTRIYDFNTERSELLLFKGSDVGGTNGPDRIRLSAANIVFDTYDFNTLDETFEQHRMIINASGHTIISGRLDAGLFNNSTSNIKNLNSSTINASNIVGYQQTLIAGDNISIVGNTISSTGGALPADVNFSTVNASVINGDNLSTATMIMSSDMLLDGFSNVLSISQTAKNEIRDSVINALSFQDLDTKEITADRLEVSFFGFTSLVTAVEVKSTNGNFSTLNASNIPGYQKTLTAGTGISITNNVISATGGGGSLPADANFSSVTATTGNFSTINSSNLSTGSIRFSSDFTFDTFSKTLNLAQSAGQAIANIEDNGLTTVSVNTSSLNVDGLTSLDAVSASIQFSTPLGIMTTLNNSTFNSSIANISVITGNSIDIVDIGCDNISGDNASFINITATSITAPNVQPTLTAGSNINITNNVISATQYVLPSSVNFSNVSTINLSATNISATSITAPNVQPTLTAGTGISITNNVISATGGGGALPSNANFSNVSTINLSATNISATSITAPNVQPTLTAGTNIGISNNTISTSSTPSFTNLTITNDFNNTNQPCFHTTYSGVIGSVSSSRVVDYNSIIFDNRNAYNTTNKRYTIPVAGTYFLYFSVVNTTSQFRCALRRNGVILDETRANSEGDDRTVAGTRSFIIECTAGQYVDVLLNLGSIRQRPSRMFFGGFKIC